MSHRVLGAQFPQAAQERIQKAKPKPRKPTGQEMTLRPAIRPNWKRP